MSLTTHLLLRITLAGLLCWLVLTVAILGRLRHEGQAAIDAQADRLKALTEQQVWRQLIALDSGTRIPDLARVAFHFGRPVCLRYKGFDMTETVTWGCDTQRPPVVAPAWLDRWLDQSGTLPRGVDRTITLWSVRDGVLTVVPSRDVVIEDLWQRLADLTGLTAATILALNGLMLLALRRLLRPTGDMVAALDRLAHGDLASAAVPRGAREFRRVLQGIDSLRQSLGQLTAQRGALTARLIDSQEAERRDLARDLHDEMGQGLAALQAISGGLRMSAQAQESARLEDTDALDATITQLHAGLRAILGRLRPPLLETQGLAFALHELVGGWNARQRASAAERPPLRAELCTPRAGLPALPPVLDLGLYRAIQEALTNAARYASPEVPVRIAIEACRTEVVLSVENACAGGSFADGSPRGSGLGLRMMAERIASLGGTLTTDHPVAGRFALRARWPLPPAAGGVGP